MRPPGRLCLNHQMKVKVWRAKPNTFTIIMALSLLSCLPPLLQTFVYPWEELLRGFNFCCSFGLQKNLQCPLEQSPWPQSARAKLLKGHQYEAERAEGSSHDWESVYVFNTPCPSRHCPTQLLQRTICSFLSDWWRIFNNACRPNGVNSSPSDFTGDPFLQHKMWLKSNYLFTPFIM